MLYKAPIRNYSMSGTENRPLSPNNKNLNAVALEARDRFRRDRALESLSVFYRIKPIGRYQKTRVEVMLDRGGRFLCELQRGPDVRGVVYRVNILGALWGKGGVLDG